MSDTPQGGPGWSARYPGQPNDAPPPASAPGFIPPGASPPPQPAWPAQPYSYGAPPPGPPPEQRWTSNRGLVAAVIGVPALLLVAAIAVILMPSTTSTSAPNGGSDVTFTPAASPTESTAQLAHDYSTAAVGINAADATFWGTLDTAMAKPCSCPAGEFDARPVLVALPAWQSAHGTWDATLNDLADKASGQLKQDLTTLSADDEANTARAADLFRNPTAASVANIDALDAQVAADHELAAKIRRELGLPASTPSS